MRAFIAVELPDEIKKNITGRINELKEVGSGVRWVEEQNLHITLKFLGRVEEKKVDNLIGLVTGAAAGTGSFKAKFEGIGTFPPGKKPRVIWVGISEGGNRLIGLANSLGESEFSPHVTIGRIKDNKGVDKLKEKIESVKELKFGEAVIDSINIMKSTLTPKGPVYETIKEVKL